MGDDDPREWSARGIFFNERLFTRFIAAFGAFILLFT